ncbi:MAG: cupin domain-containing protein [Spirochaetales bacterium]
MLVKRSSMPVKETTLRGGPGTLFMTDLTGGVGPCKNCRLLSYVRIPPGAGIGLHRHEHETEYYIILEGAGVVMDNGKEVQVTAGDCVITGHGSEHSILNNQSTDLRLIAVIITHSTP